MDDLHIRFRNVTEDPILNPSRSYSTDAGYDLRASRNYTIFNGLVSVIKTGIEVAIPRGYVGLICPRSGLAAKHGITVVNAPGIIDSGYRGEIKILLTTLLKEEISIERYDRVAQLVITPRLTNSRMATTLPPGEDDREDKGFGSTGK